MEAHLSKGFGAAGYVAELRSLLAKYESPGCASKVRVKLIEVATEEQAETAKRAGLSKRQAKSFLPASDAVIDLRRGYSGLAFRYGSESDVLSFWPPEDTASMEFFVTSKLRELVARKSKSTLRIGVSRTQDTNASPRPSLATWAARRCVTCSSSMLAMPS